jgi:hypothetical protein
MSKHINIDDHIEVLVKINEQMADLEAQRKAVRDAIAKRIRHRYQPDTGRVTPYSVGITNVRAHIRAGYSAFRVTKA